MPHTWIGSHIHTYRGKMVASKKRKRRREYYPKYHFSFKNQDFFTKLTITQLPFSQKYRTLAPVSSVSSSELSSKASAMTLGTSCSNFSFLDGFSSRSLFSKYSNNVQNQRVKVKVKVNLLEGWISILKHINETMVVTNFKNNIYEPLYGKWYFVSLAKLCTMSIYLNHDIYIYYPIYGDLLFNSPK